MTKLSAPDADGLRARYPDVFDRPVSSRLAMPAMLIGAFAIFVFGLVDLEFSPARMLAGIEPARLDRDDDDSAGSRLLASGLSGGARRNPVDRAARHHACRCVRAAGQPAGGQEHRAVESVPVSGSPLSRFDPRRRHPDLGAGLDQRRRPRAVCRRAGDCRGGFRRVRQIVLRSDRSRRQEAGRGHPGVRRQRAARNPLRADAAGAACDRRAGALFHRVRTPARQPSSASSAPAASACNWPSRSGCWNGRRCHS